mgnify:CR=1 FL=1
MKYATISALILALVTASAAIAAPTENGYCNSHWSKCLWQKINDASRGR